MENDIIVSVCMITYNHEKYIAEAIEGVLMQQTIFPIELVIGEDCSTDNTRKICLEYREKYPNKIKLLLHEKNLGIVSNFYATLQAAQGKYIALCEGDDYWTDPCKLQKQVDFLEANEDASMCFHNAKLINAEGNKIGSCRRYEKDQYASIEDLLITGGVFCPTASLMFRAQYIKSGYPDYCLNCHVGDFPLQLYLSSQGKIYYFNDEMSAYRKNPVAWSRTFGKTEFSLRAKGWMSEFKVLDGINALFDYKYASVIVQYEARYLIGHILLPNRNQKSEIKKIFGSYISKFPFREKVKIFLICHAFFIYRLLSK